MKANKLILSAAVSALTLGSVSTFAEGSFTEALTSGKAYGDFRLRYEGVSDDDLGTPDDPSTTDMDETKEPTDDASALTLRTRLGYTTGSISGFSATVEFEDSRVVGAFGDYNAAGLNGQGEYSVIADPETTELDQFLVKYKNDVVTAKLGRQVLTLDGHRFVGHVGWRQDRQTFDGISTVITPIKDLSINLAYLGQRNRIFAEAADKDSEDFLANLSYTTPVGKLTGYGYFLAEEDVDNSDIDTIGVSFAPKVGPVNLYFEYATQDATKDNVDVTANYMNVEVSGKAGPVKIKGGYEVLGSDSGDYSFSTPLATLHKFNGWADQFLVTPKQGLVDLSLTAAMKAGPGKVTVAYHMYSSDEELVVVDESYDDLGSEINAVYGMKFGKNYNAGVKYAAYSAGDEAFKKVDTNKFWLWVGASF